MLDLVNINRNLVEQQFGTGFAFSMFVVSYGASNTLKDVYMVFLGTEELFVFR